MTGPRIPPIDVESASAEVRALLTPSAAKGSNGTNWFSTVMHSEGLYRVWRPIARYFNTNSLVPFRDHELVVLRTAWLCRSDYEWGQHVLVARAGGMSDDEILRIKEGASAEGLTDQDRMLLELPDQLWETARVDDDLWSRLAAHYDHGQLLEFVMLIGHYVMVGLAMNVTRVVPEVGAPELGQV